MKRFCCSFCLKLDKENDLGELFQASKKVYYHLNCVMWSCGMLRKNYFDKNDYITHLYETSCKKECSMCGLSGPTIIYTTYGKIKEYYHYLCVARKGMDIDSSHCINWIDFKEEIYINSKSNNIGEERQDIFEKEDVDSSGIIKKRKRKNDEITSASSATLSEEEEDTERQATYEPVGKKPRDENYKISSEESVVYLYKPDEDDDIQQQQQLIEEPLQNHIDSLSFHYSPFNKINTDNNTTKDLLDISVPSLGYKEFEQFQPPPPQQQKQTAESCNNLQPQQSQPQLQQQLSQQQSSIYPDEQNRNKIHSTPLLNNKPQYILPQPHSPILSSILSPQQQIKIQEQQKSQMLMTAISSHDCDVNNNNNNIFSYSKHILENQIYKKKTKHVNNNTTDIPSHNLSSSPPILIELSDTNSSSSNNINCDFHIECDIDDSNSISYQLPPDSFSYIKNNNSSKDISSKGIDYKSIFKYKNNGEVLKYNIYIEERDMLDVRITKRNKVICDGIFICVFGPSNYFDCLRSNKPLEIPIEKGVDEEDFSNIFNNSLTSQISLIRLIVDDYSSTCPLKILLTKLSQKNLVGYLDYNEYELFIIPNGMNIMKCASFNFIIDRYMRNGPVIPAWVLLIAKANNNIKILHSTSINH